LWSESQVSGSEAALREETGVTSTYRHESVVEWSVPGYASLRCRTASSRRATTRRCTSRGALFRARRARFVGGSVRHVRAVRPEPKFAHEAPECRLAQASNSVRIPRTRRDHRARDGAEISERRDGIFSRLSRMSRRSRTPRSDTVSNSAGAGTYAPRITDEKRRQLRPRLRHCHNDREPPLMSEQEIVGTDFDGTLRAAV
jgi:hypothetical protein